METVGMATAASRFMDSQMSRTQPSVMYKTG